jgi:CO dehydrogenase maturation factor
MAFTLAVAGKGGTGKTTLAALLIQTLIERGEGPILAVDADPNPNLGYALGCRVEKTISELRDELLDHIRKLPPGVTKDDYLEMGIQECLWEGRGVDLLVMGAGEGPRCYCAVNNVLRRCIDRLRGAYRYVVMDNEAGLEHLSRCTTQDVDVLLIVSNDLPVSLQAAFRIRELTKKLALRIGGQYLVLNDVGTDVAPQVGAHGHPVAQSLRAAGHAPLLARQAGLELLGVVPSDSRLRQLSREGEPLTQLAPDSAARRALREILDAALSPTAAAL